MYPTERMKRRMVRTEQSAPVTSSDALGDITATAGATASLSGYNLLAKRIKEEETRDPTNINTPVPLAGGDPTVLPPAPMPPDPLAHLPAATRARIERRKPRARS